VTRAVYLAVWALGAAVVMILGYAVWADEQQPYENYQLQFRTLVAERLGTDKAALVPSGIQQIWLEDAQSVDRCTTCHLGLTWEGFEDLKQPFSTHPAWPLEHHAIEEFGCTLCHGGQGYAVQLPDAHGWVRHWEEPLYDSQLAADYGFSSVKPFLEVKCNTCHRFDRETAGMDHINQAKQLVNEKGCRACHTINDRGGTIGPELNNVGERSPEQYDYSRLTTFPSVFNWQVAHLQNPKSFSPDTIMPEFGFDSNSAKALALLLLSWRDEEIPPELLPGAILRDEPTAEEAERERIMQQGEGKFFVEKTCFICHDVSSFGIESATKIGPDLAIAVDDAPRRFGRTLDDFLRNPSGTMQVVLSRQIQLTEEEIEEAIRLLKIANQKYKEQQQSEAAKEGPEDIHKEEP